MNISRVITLSLGLAFAVFALGYANPSLAGKSDKTCPEHPSCKPDDPEPPTGGIDYTATLTGAFAFENVVVFPDSKNLQLKSLKSIIITRPDDGLRTLWNSVFRLCPNFFGPTPIDVLRFEAPPGRKGWSIDKPGGVRVNFNSIPFTVPVNEEVEVTLVLIGDTEYQFPFLPDVPTEGDNPTTITHDLKSFWIYGKSGRGAPDKHCTDGSEEGIGELTVDSTTLTITATLALTPP